MATTTENSNLDAWKNLLAMSTKVSTDEKLNDVYKKLEGDVEAVEQLSMKAENMQFLELAMREAVGVQAEDSGPCLFSRFFQLGETEPNVLVNSPEKIAAAKELADQLDDYLLLGNFAEQFKQANGMKALRNLTLSPNEEISLLYLRLIPSLAENRPEFQRVVVESELFTAYLQLLDRCRDTTKKDKTSAEETFVPQLSPMIMQAVISAVSSCVRGFEPGWAKFFEMKGVNKLVRIAAQSDDVKTAARAAHLLWAINFNFSEPDQKKKPIPSKTTNKTDNNKDEVEEFCDENDLFEQYLAGKHRNTTNKPGQDTKKKAPMTTTTSRKMVDLTPAQARLNRLRNQLVIVYASLDSRILMMKEEQMDTVDEEGADGQAFAFLMDTFEQIQHLLLSIDRDEIGIDAKNELSTYIKTKNRQIRREKYKAELETDLVAKHLGVPQWYTKEEMIGMKKKEAAEMEKLMKTSQAILSEEKMAKDRMDKEEEAAKKKAPPPKSEAPVAPKPSKPRKSMGGKKNKK